MIRNTFALAVLFGIATTYSVQPVNTQSRPSIAPVVYDGARLIPGDGSPPIASSSILVEDGMITRVGTKGSLNAPLGSSVVDLTGKTVMPTLIDAHAHPGFQRGLTYSADNFTRENIMDDLDRALYFGVAVVQSQGIEKGEVVYQIRADQEAGKLGGARLRIAGRGIGAPNAGPGGAAYGGIVYEVTTADQGRSAVRELAAKKVNLIKIWVDDRNGRAPSLPRGIFSPIIDEGHRHGLQVNAHVFYHADAVDLVNAGIDSLVHLVSTQTAKSQDVTVWTLDSREFSPTLEAVYASSSRSDRLDHDRAILTMVGGGVAGWWLNRLFGSFQESTTLTTEKKLVFVDARACVKAVSTVNEFRDDA